MISSFIASILLWKKVSSAMAVAGAVRRLCLEWRELAGMEGFGWWKRRRAVGVEVGWTAASSECCRVAVLMMAGSFRELAAER